MNIIQEYGIVTERIAVTKSQITRAKRDLQKNLDVYKPNDIKAITYDKERVQESTNQEGILVVAQNISILTNFINELEDKLQELYQQRSDLERVINGLGDTKKKVAMYMIQGYPQWKIARELHYSKSWIEKLCRQINKECSESAQKSC